MQEQLKTIREALNYALQEAEFDLDLDDAFAALHQIDAAIAQKKGGV